VRIAVEGIPAAGREIDLGPRQAWAVEAATNALDRRPEQLEGVVTLQRATKGGAVRVGVRAVAAADATCDRCGEPTRLVADVDTLLLYGPQESEGLAFEGEIELDAEELDVGWYTDGHIDLGQVLQEALALALPVRVVCADTEACDKRTDALLTPARAESPFSVLMGFVPGRGGKAES
jgi:uncharacterized metal-binding protein YceD (DUF177 family)